MRHPFLNLVLLSLVWLPPIVAAQSTETEIREKAERAGQAMQSRDFELAITLYEELAQELTLVPGIRMNLGLAHFMAGNFNDAQRHLSQAVEADANLETGWLFLGASYLELQRPEEAISPLQVFLKKKPDQNDALLMLGDAYLQSGRYLEASDQFRGLSLSDRDNARVWINLGRAYEGLAGLAFMKLSDSDPESDYVFSLIAASRVAQQQYSSAFFFYRKALEKNPKLRGIHIAISRIYRERGHEEWAQAEEEKEIELGVPDCEREKLVCSFLSGNFLSVLELTRKQETSEGLYWQSQAANQLAIQSFSKLAELPPSFEYHQFRAEVQRNQGRHWESIKEWEKALELSPGNLLAKRELALSVYLNRDYDRARKLAKELLAVDPRSGQLNFLIGDSYLYEQQVEEALPFLVKAVEYDPSFTAARSSLGRAYITLGDDEKAIPHLKEALTSDEDGSLHYQLARAYQKTGQRELARETLATYQEIKQRLSQEEEELEEEVQITPP